MKILELPSPDSYDDWKDWARDLIQQLQIEGVEVEIRFDEVDADPSAP